MAASVSGVGKAVAAIALDAKDAVLGGDPVALVGIARSALTEAAHGASLALEAAGHAVTSPIVAAAKSEAATGIYEQACEVIAVPWALAEVAIQLLDFREG